MTKKVIPIIGIAALVLAMVGCETTHPFTTYKDTWAIAHGAYQIHIERVVQGKVTAGREQQADLAWNQFRAAFKASLQAARMNWEAATPEPLQDKAIAFTTLLKEE